MRSVLLTLTSLVLASPAVAGGDTIIVQQSADGWGGRIAQDFSDSQFPEMSTKSWDDFSTDLDYTMGSGLAEFTDVPGFENIPFLIEISDGPGGVDQPGGLGTHILMQATGLYDPESGYVTFDFGGEVLPAGEWWISVQAQGGFDEFGQIFWQTSNHHNSVGSQQMFHNPPGGLGFGTDPFPGEKFEGFPADVAFMLSGDEVNSTSLSDVEVHFGFLLSGGLAQLGTSDDDHLQTRSKFGFSAFEPNLMEILIGAITTVEAPSSVDLTIESRINHPTGVARVRLRNWETQSFEHVAEYSIGQQENTFMLEGAGSGANVRDSDGRVVLSIKHIVVAVFTAQGFDSGFDWVELAAN